MGKTPVFWNTFIFQRWSAQEQSENPMAIGYGDSLTRSAGKTKHYKAIENNIVALCDKTVNTSKLTLQLVECKVLDFDVRDGILAKPLEEQLPSLYILVAKKDVQDFDNLLEALRKSGNSHVRNILEESMNQNAESVQNLMELRYNDADEENQYNGKRRYFQDVRKRDIFRFCMWGIAAFSLFTIAAVVVSLYFKGQNKPHQPLPAPQSNNSFNARPETKEESGPGKDYDISTQVPARPPSSNFGRTPAKHGTFAMVVTSPEFQMPGSLDPSTSINLTISSEEKYDWRKWALGKAARAIETLSLNRSPFNETDIHYFLQTMTNIRNFNILHGGNLCDQLTGNTLEHGLATEYHKNIRILRISVIPECEHLYKYLAKHLELPSLETLIFERVFISRSNFPFIHDLFYKHRKHLKKIIFFNVTLCDSCEVFKGIVFTQLEDVRLFFFNAATAGAGGSVKNLSEGSKTVRRFRSNVHCENMDLTSVVNNWQRLSSYDSVCLH